jgi:PadR family transcriptional regulator, regulatory protein PadR
MAKTSSLGEFEQIVLLAVLRLGENAYGVTILTEIAERTGRNASPGALYTTLHRMEDKGLVTFRDGSPTPERGGRAKRFVTVTREGRNALASAQAAYRSLMEGLDLLSPTHAQKARVNGPPMVRGARGMVQAGCELRGVYA